MFTLYSCGILSLHPATVLLSAQNGGKRCGGQACRLSRDYVCAEYRNHYRNGEKFLARLPSRGLRQ